MRGIRRVIVTDPSCECNFALTFDEILGTKGGTRRSPYYLMTEEGFMLLVIDGTSRHSHCRTANSQAALR
ncbi:hypothetical protein [Paraburkholderia silvatlantica]|uniref:hypothetical protein n=1 Tax=Paraburkholderia silvatlantica TaxID=321895 RepID=UPI003CC666DA